MWEEKKIKYKNMGPSRDGCYSFKRHSCRPQWEWFELSYYKVSPPPSPLPPTAALVQKWFSTPRAAYPRWAWHLACSKLGHPGWHWSGPAPVAAAQTRQSRTPWRCRMTTRWQLCSQPNKWEWKFRAHTIQDWCFLASPKFSANGSLVALANLLPVNYSHPQLSE